jgi:hypothetical protein
VRTSRGRRRGWAQGTASGRWTGRHYPMVMRRVLLLLAVPTCVRPQLSSDERDILKTIYDAHEWQCQAHGAESDCRCALDTWSQDADAIPCSKWEGVECGSDPGSGSGTMGVSVVGLELTNCGFQSVPEGVLQVRRGPFLENRPAPQTVFAPALAAGVPVPPPTPCAARS